MPWVLTILNFLGVIAKNPLVQKFAFFSTFTAIVHYSITYFMDTYLVPYLSSMPFSSLACQLGAFTAINLFITILVAGFATKQALAFIRS